MNTKDYFDIFYNPELPVFIEYIDPRKKSSLSDAKKNQCRKKN